MKFLFCKLVIPSWLPVLAVVIGAAIASRSYAEAPPAPEGNQMANQLVKNGGMEEGDKLPSAWKQGAAIPGVRYTWDRKRGHDSESSLSLQKTANRYFPIAQWYQLLPNSRRTSKLKVRAQVKAEKATKGIVDVLYVSQGGKQTHPWVAYIGAKNGGDPPVSHDWKEYSGVVDVPEGTTHIAVALQIYGPGKLWFDDVCAEFVSDETPRTDALSGKAVR